MSSEILKSAVESALSKLGERRLVEELAKLTVDSSQHEADTLTIIANRGVHHLPQKFMRGEIYFASEGSLDFSSPESVEKEMVLALSRLASKLKSKAWQKIYLVPFGPTNLSILIKLLVYRVTHVETVDLFHVGSGSYLELNIPLRDVVIDAP